MVAKLNAMVFAILHCKINIALPGNDSKLCAQVIALTVGAIVNKCIISQYGKCTIFCTNKLPQTGCKLQWIRSIGTVDYQLPSHSIVELGKPTLI